MRQTRLLDGEASRIHRFLGRQVAQAGLSAVLALPMLALEHDCTRVQGTGEACPIRQRFDDDTIEALLKLQWWHWDIAKITHNLKAICGADLTALQQAI